MSGPTDRDKLVLKIAGDLAEFYKDHRALLRCVADVLGRLAYDARKNFRHHAADAFYEAEDALAEISDPDGKIY